LRQPSAEAGQQCLCSHSTGMCVRFQQCNYSTLCLLLYSVSHPPAHSTQHSSSS
jgi:hypothetical protein